MRISRGRGSAKGLGNGVITTLDGEARKKKLKRAYAPAVEPLEALRLFSGAAATAPVPAGMAVEQGSLATPTGLAGEASSDSAWDAALAGAQVSSLLAADAAAVSPADARDTAAGLAQLDRYLGRTWSRAGIAPGRQDDCTQAVYLTLLQNLGRGRFDALVQDIGASGIPDVLSRETPEGPDFFRAIDMVKKRAQRERNAQALDPTTLAAASSSAPGPSSLQEAIARTLNPRETALIQATLQGETPAEIAEHWGVAPKTVSNEKTRAFQKLREFLAADTVD